MELESLYIRCEVSAGTSIEKAINEAMELQHRLACTIIFKFNGVSLYVYKWDNYQETFDKILNKFFYELKQI